VPSTRKTALTLDEAISLPELHFPSWGRIFNYVDAKYSTLGTRGLLFQAFVFLTSSKHKNPHTGWQEPQSDQKNSLYVNKEISSLWSQKYTGRHRVYSMIA
jgi:hypothetical protein